MCFKALKTFANGMIYFGHICALSLPLPSLLSLPLLLPSLAIKNEICFALTLRQMRFVAWVASLLFAHQCHKFVKYRRHLERGRGRERGAGRGRRGQRQRERQLVYVTQISNDRNVPRPLLPPSLPFSLAQDRRHSLGFIWIFWLRSQKINNKKKKSNKNNREITEVKEKQKRKAPHRQFAFRVTARVSP